MRILKNRLTSILVGASLLTLTPAFAQVNEDEWYDPSDWFDANNYEYDDTLGLDYSYWDDELVDDEFDWTLDGYDYDYEYEWDDDLYGYDYDDNYGYDYDDEWGYNDEDWGLDDDWNEDEWGYDDEEVYGGFGESEEGYDWGFSRGYGSQASWNSNSDSRQRSSQMSSRRQGRQFSQSTQASQQQKQQKQVSGTLERVRTLTMRDKNDQSTKLTVAQVELQKGRDILVAFKAHPDQRQRRIQLEPGHRLQARGKVGLINGRRVLMADQIRSNGRTFDVRQISTQSSQGTGSAARFQSGGSQQPERGRVQRTSRYRSSSGDEHTLLLIQFENGRTALVDLGPNVEF